MSNLLMTYYKADLFPSLFKLEDSSIASMESTSVPIERNESIHSGHFMVSEIEESEQEKIQKQTTTESDYEREEENRILSDFDFQTKENSQTYVYGTKSSACVQIDGSLTKLFECMSLAYSGKITSPKWKTFKGLKLHIKDKIRLNNIIWRAWHIQYIAGRNPVVCQFSSSVDSKRHKRIEAILLEGKYWKRRVNAVKEEYKKWRMFHRKTGGPQTPSRPSDFDWESCLPRWSTNLSNIDSLFSHEDYTDFFSSNLNAQNSFGNYYDYNSRDIARSGMGAQFMQPGLEQLQPNVDFMDTFEPIHDVISRFQNHTFSLPTVQEEPNFNKEQEDLLGLFAAGNDQSSISVENDLSKPILESNTYSGSDMFQTSNEMLNLNAKLDTTVMTEQQDQSRTMHESFNMAKLELPSNYSYSTQIMGSNNVFGATQSMHDNSTPQLSQVQVKPQIGIDSLYSNKLSFESNSGPMGPPNNPTRKETNNVFAVSRFQSPTNVGTSEVQSQANQMTAFQPESIMFYSDQDNSAKSSKKYSYVPYFANNVAISNSVNPSTEVTHKIANQNRSRSKSITMPQVQAQALAASLASSQVQSNKASVTIKSLLNKPSLVSTMNSNESSFAANNSFRVPNQSEIQMRANIERSLSLPIYTQRKSGTNGNQLILQRLQTSDSVQNQFDSNAKHTDTNYSFDSGLNNFFQNSLSATTSPLSSHSSSYSNQDSQVLPQLSNNNSQQIRKISQPGLDYAGKVSDAQLGISSLAGDRVTFNSPSSNLITNLLQVNSSTLSQNNVFSPHPSTSSSSSSPIGSLDGTKVNTTNNSFGPFTLSNVQSQFNALNKNNLLKMDFGKDHVKDLKRNLKTANIFDFTSTKEKNLSNSISSAYSPTDLGLSSSSSQVQKGRELSFKHIPSGALSPNTLGSLGLPVKSEDRIQYRERRRVCHINAEQKRRCNIKNGFDTLRNLLPSLSSNTNTKISKAAMLQKAADYIRILKSEKYDQQKEYEMLKQQVESLNQTISVFQNQLPATGAPITGQRSSQIKEQYAEYVHNRTMQNWKFWIFSIIMESLLDSYCNTVATTNLEEMCKTLYRWFDQNCCLITLRRDVLNSLRFISTSTNILTNPESLPEEALFAVTKSKSPSKDDDCFKKYTGS